MQHITRYTSLIAAVTALGGFLFGFDTSVIADIHQQASQQLGLTSWQWSTIVASGVLGCMVGIPLSGCIADSISRRFLLQWVAVGFILGTLCCTFAHSFFSLLGGRFLIGMCIGVASYITPLFIAEIAPATRRGGLVLLNGLALTFGQAVAYLIGYALHDVSYHSWRFIVGTGIIPATLLLVGMAYVPHSPRWLFKQFGLEEAKAILQTIRATAGEVETELAGLNACKTSFLTQRVHLIKPPICYVLIAGVVLGLFQQFSGINAILYYGPLIFSTAGFSPFSNALLATFCLGVINFIFTAITLLSVDKVGRRTMLISGTLLAGVSLLATTALFPATFPGHHYWLLLAFSFYIMGYCISLGSLFWVIISEIYPLTIRAHAMSIATFIQWAGNFIVAISFLKLHQTLGPSLTMGLFGCVCLLACAFCYRFIPETTGISLEEIEQNLIAGQPLRELGQPKKAVISEWQPIEI